MGTQHLAPLSRFALRVIMCRPVYIAMAEWEEENEPADKQYVPARTAPTVDLSQYEEDDLSIFRILAGEPPDRG
jgi:hypothetical protein